MPRPAEFDRKKVLDKAMDLFWCQGYEATSTQELTQAMGIKPGSLYNAFHDKHSLYLETLERYQQTEGRCLYVLLEDAVSPLAGIKQFFAAIVEQSVNDTQRRGCFMVNATLELGSHDPEVQARVEKATTAGKAMLTQAVQQAQAAGEIGAHHDSSELAEFLMNTVQGLRVTAKINPNQAVLEGIVSVALSTLS